MAFESGHLPLVCQDVSVRTSQTAAAIVREASPSYAYPVAPISTVAESRYLQRYFAEHRPRLTIPE